MEKELPETKNQTPTPQIPEKKTQKQKIISAVIWIVVVVAVVLVSYFFTSNFIMRWPIEGESMLPTINNQDNVLLFRTKNINYNDVIIFKEKTTHKVLIKRVIGKENDIIATKFDKKNNIYHIYRNGEQVSEKTIKSPMYGGGWEETEVTVPKGKFYILGDNRNNSYDSSEGLFADIDDIYGVVFLRIGQNGSIGIIN